MADPVISDSVIYSASTHTHFQDYMSSGSAPKRIKREELSGDEGSAEVKGEAEAAAAASEVKSEPTAAAAAEQQTKSASSATAADSTTPTRPEDSAEGGEASAGTQWKSQLDLTHKFQFWGLICNENLLL